MCSRISVCRSDGEPSVPGRLAPGHEEEQVADTMEEEVDDDEEEDEEMPRIRYHQA